MRTAISRVQWQPQTASCFAPIGAQQRGKAAGFMKGAKPTSQKTPYCRGEYKADFASLTSVGKLFHRTAPL